MDTAKMNSVTEYMCTHEEVAKFFPGLIIRRMSWIDKLLHSAGLKYSFDVVFDETEDDMPTAYFIIQDFEDEKNEITMFLTNIRTIEFFGRTVCVDIYNVEDAVYKMISADSGDGIGLVFFAIGLIFVALIVKKNRKIKWLLENGQVIHGTVTEIVFNTCVNVNGRHPRVVYCSYQDPGTGMIYQFKSRNIYDSITNCIAIGDSIDIYVDPENYAKNYVDVDKPMERIVSYT